MLATLANKIKSRIRGRAGYDNLIANISLYAIKDEKGDLLSHSIDIKAEWARNTHSATWWLHNPKATVVKLTLIEVK